MPRPASNRRYMNSVCHFTPSGASDFLQVISTLLIERYPKTLREGDWTAPLVPANALGPRVIYSPADGAVLATLRGE